jgi:hypothetical protein
MAKGQQVAEMMTKTLRDQRQHIACDRIGFELRRRWIGHALFGGFAIFAVKVPHPAGWGCAVHQHAGAAAQQPVIILHHETFSALRPIGKIRAGVDEAVIGEDGTRQTGQRGPALLHRQHAPFAGFDRCEPRGGMAAGGTNDFAVEILRVGGIIKRNIIDRPAGGAQFIGEMAHRAEDESDFFGVVANVSGFVTDFDHQDGNGLR